MTPGADWPLGLACMAHALSRDLQRAARAAGGPAALWGGTSAQLAHWRRAVRHFTPGQRARRLPRLV